MKRIEILGRFFRERRGQLVMIPEKWVGQVTTPQTINKRQSKLTHKLARQEKQKHNRTTGYGLEYIDGRHAMVDDEA